MSLGENGNRCMLLEHSLTEVMRAREKKGFMQWRDRITKHASINTDLRYTLYAAERRPQRDIVFIFPSEESVL